MLRDSNKVPEHVSLAVDTNFTRFCPADARSDSMKTRSLCVRYYEQMGVRKGKCQKEGYRHMVRQKSIWRLEAKASHKVVTQSTTCKSLTLVEMICDVCH